MFKLSQCSTVRVGLPAAWVLAAALLATNTGCHVAADGQNLEGKRLFEQGQYSAALQRFQLAVANDSRNADAYYNMARTYHAMGVQTNNQQYLSQAETLYNQCLDLNEDHVECHRGLAVMLAETGRSDRAFKLLNNWAVGSPQMADAQIELARLYQEFGDKETARIHLDRAIRIDQNSARAWTALGQMREQAGDAQQALVDYQRSYNLNSFQPAVAQRIAALQRSATGSFDPSKPGGTRTVNNANNPPLRY